MLFRSSLVGLKENVIIGKLIPAGTGMARYRQVQAQPFDWVAPGEEADESEILDMTGTEGTGVTASDLIHGPVDKD